MIQLLRQWQQRRIHHREKIARQRGVDARYRVLFALSSGTMGREFRTLAAARRIYDRLPHARKMLVDLEKGVIERSFPAEVGNSPWSADNFLGPDEPFAFF